MFRQPSDTLKQKAAHAKRTASILRGIAALPEIPAADQTTLTKAARILDGIAGHKRKESAAAKTAEQKRDRALAVAQPEARRLVAAWPAASFVDQVAIIRVSTTWYWYRKQFLDMETALTADKAAKDLAWALGEARMDLASHLAWKAATGGGDLATLEGELRARLVKARADAETQGLVRRLQALLTPAEVPA